MWHGTGWTLEVYGAKGTLVASASTLPQLASSIRLEGARYDEKALAPLEIPSRLRWAPDDLGKVEPFNTGQMFRRFAESINNGTTAHPNFDDAVENHRLLAAIVRSSDTGRRVSLN
jgi:predicted dehydrogenase